MQQALEALEWMNECAPHKPATDAITALRAALAEQAQPVAWISVAERLPASGQIVLACYVNRAGRLRRIRAEWIAAKTREANSEDAEACVEYDEATDTYYTTEGWYECIDNWGDYSSVAVTEGEVTHWMPLPPEPGAAPEAPTPPAPVHQPVHGWTDADADAARLALELECLLTDGDMPTASVSRWWESAHEALRLHRERLATTPAAPGQKGWDMERVELLRKIKSMGVQR